MFKPHVQIALLNGEREFMYCPDLDQFGQYFVRVKKLVELSVEVVDSAGGVQCFKFSPESAGKVYALCVAKDVEEFISVISGDATLDDLIEDHEFCCGAGVSRDEDYVEMFLHGVVGTPRNYIFRLIQGREPHHWTLAFVFPDRDHGDLEIRSLPLEWKGFTI